MLSYLHDQKYWDLKTSILFDPAWYRRSSGLSASINPLVDFWTRGFDKRFSPAPELDMHFFRDAVCRDRWDDRSHAFDLFAPRKHTVPLNPSALRAAQRAFHDGIAYRVIRQDPARSRNLVFVQAGATFTAPYLDASRDFDILLNHYDGPARADPRARIVIAQNGTKTTAIRTILRRDPAILLAYDAVLFLDDDIDIDAPGLSRLFTIFEREQLDLAQSSLTASSDCYFACLRQPLAGGGTRGLNAVEIMMPLLSRRALETCGWVFGEGISGWGVDWLLGAKVREAFGDRIALIGDVVAGHERRVDTASGRFYTYLRAHGIDAPTEAGFLIREYGLDPVIAFAGRAADVPRETMPKQRQRR